VAAATDATYLCMHWRGHSDVMQTLTAYDGPGGVVGAVRDELAQRVEAAGAAGIRDDRLVLDPGLGFAKTAEHNWELLRRLDVIEELGLPVLVGASRKAFLGRLLAGEDGELRPVGQREAAHTALVALLAARGLWGLRVHDVRATRDALAVVERMAP
jgi:dihydropteroate synthase